MEDNVDDDVGEHILDGHIVVGHIVVGHVVVGHVVVGHISHYFVQELYMLNYIYYTIFSSIL